MDEALVVNEDIALLSTMQDRNCSCTTSAFLALVARLQNQAVVFEVFMKLCAIQMIDTQSALEELIDLDKLEPEVWKVRMTLLRSSEFGHEINNPADIFMSSYYIMPLTWLSCVIVRGAVVSLDDVVESIYGHSQGASGAADYRKH